MNELAINILSQHIEPENKSTKQQFIDNLQKWVAIDTQLKMIHEKTKQIRESKEFLIQKIYTYIHDNNITSNKINMNNEEVIFYEKKEYPPLTYTYIEKCLSEIIPEKKQVDFIIQYLKSKREIKHSHDIRKISKK